MYCTYSPIYRLMAAQIKSHPEVADSLGFWWRNDIITELSCKWLPDFGWRVNDDTLLVYPGAAQLPPATFLPQTNKSFTFSPTDEEFHFFPTGKQKNFSFSTQANRRISLFPHRQTEKFHFSPTGKQKSFTFPPQANRKRSLFPTGKQKKITFPPQAI